MATTAAVVGFAGPASADVQIQPGDFHQGDGAQLTFHVTNSNPRSAMTRIEMRMPEQYPIAEVYPMAATNWAPQQTMRDIEKPLTDRDGAPVEEVVSAITWWAMPGLELAPGAQADLNVSMGGLPPTPRMEIGIVETFADGTTANSTATVALGPPLAATDDAAAAHGNGAATDQATEPAGNSGSNLWWMFGLLILIGAVTAFALFRQRPSASIGDTVDDDDDEPAPARSLKTATKATSARTATKTAANTATKTAARTATKTAAKTATKTATAAKTATTAAPAKTAKNGAAKAVTPAKVAKNATPAKTAKASGPTPAKATERRIRASH